MAALPWRGPSFQHGLRLHWILHTTCILDWKMRENQEFPVDFVGTFLSIMRVWSKIWNSQSLPQAKELALGSIWGKMCSKWNTITSYYFCTKISTIKIKIYGIISGIPLYSRWPLHHERDAMKILTKSTCWHTCMQAHHKRTCPCILHGMPFHGIPWWTILIFIP